MKIVLFMLMVFLSGTQSYAVQSGGGNIQCDCKNREMWCESKWFGKEISNDNCGGVEKMAEVCRRECADNGQSFKVRTGGVPTVPVPAKPIQTDPNKFKNLN